MNELRSFQFLLRWRTEDEVLSGAGETTCGNTRCTFHDSHNVEEARPSLKTLELPFSYEENGENKGSLSGSDSDPEVEEVLESDVSDEEPDLQELGPEDEEGDWEDDYGLNF